MILFSNNHCSATYLQRRRRLANSSRRRMQQECTSGKLSLFLEPIPEEAAQQQDNHNHNHGAATASAALLRLANQERARRGAPPLRESAFLNAAAQRHCRRMAAAGRVHHSVASVAELQRALRATAVGENVQTGTGLPQMHRETMHHHRDRTGTNRRNLLAPYFEEYGSAIVCVETGEGRQQLYTCQLFRCATTTVEDAPDEEDHHDAYDTAWLRLDGDQRDAKTACTAATSDSSTGTATALEQ